MRTLLVGLVVGWAAVAHAQAAPPRPVVEHRSPGTAVALSATVTLGGVGMILGSAATGRWQLAPVGAAAVALGPTVGHCYSGQRYARGLIMRGIGVGVVLVRYARWFSERNSIEARREVGQVVMIAGAGLFIVGGIDDVATAGDAARRHNARRTTITRPSLVIASASRCSARSDLSSRGLPRIVPVLILLAACGGDDVRTVSAGDSAWGARFSPDGSKLAVAFGPDDHVGVIDLATDALTDLADNGSYLTGTAWSADGALPVTPRVDERGLWRAQLW